MLRTLQSEIAFMLQRSANRLHALCAAKAPTLVIENERQLLMRLLFRFPADPQAQEWLLSQQNAERQAQHEHLLATGYFTKDDDSTGTPGPQ